MGIFPGECLVSIGYTYDQLLDQLTKQKKLSYKLGIRGDREFIETGNYKALKRVIKNEKTGKELILFYLFGITPFEFTDYDFIRLAHEILHICQFYLKDVLDRNKEIEAEAYLHTHLMTQCIQLLRNKK